MLLMSKPKLVIRAFIKCIGSKRFVRILLIAQFLLAPRLAYLTFTVPSRCNTNGGGESINNIDWVYSNPGLRSLLIM